MTVLLFATPAMMAVRGAASELKDVGTYHLRVQQERTMARWLSLCVFVPFLQPIHHDARKPTGALSRPTALRPTTSVSGSFQWPHPNPNFPIHAD